MVVGASAGCLDSPFKELTLHLFVIPRWILLAIPLTVFAITLVGADWRARAIAGFQVLIIAVVSVLAHFYCPGVCQVIGEPAILKWRWVVEDPALLAVCFLCARRARRYWTLWATSAVVLILINDAIQNFWPGISLWATMSANIVWNELLEVCILVGAWPSFRARLSAAFARRDAALTSN